MAWQKLGRVYAPDKAQWWSQHYGILPTPVLDVKRRRIVIYFATTDSDRFGRICRLELNADNPVEVLESAQGPVLDVGELGCFDDCGVNPSCVIDTQDERRIYYVGFQRSVRVPYLLLSGVAIQNNDGSLRRMSRVPLLERTTDEPWIRSAPSVLHESGGWRMWYVSATSWERHDSGVFAGKLMPHYNLRYAESLDGLRWKVVGGPVLPCRDDEFGFGRPWVVRRGSRLLMWYSIRRSHRTYRIGCAESVDGTNWTRLDEKVGIDASASGWDSEMICYPAVVTWGGKDILFYNGNSNGETGFGVAVRESSDSVGC